MGDGAVSDRRPLSKKVRFDVFKRDVFTCQYCGQRPPAVVLEIDHIVALANGGADTDDNLMTACFDCNRGKGAGSLQCIPLDVQRKAELIAERAAQVAAYDRLLRREKKKREAAIDRVNAIYEATFDGWFLSDSGRRSVRTFLEKLPPSEVEDAMQKACDRKPHAHAFKYFCGICWNKIKREGAAT